jgi:hypothetical protein
MAIIISKNGKNAKRLNQSTFDKEDYLQQYIYNNPDAVPVYEIDEDTRLLILAREFSTASGPIDALGIDQHGNIYLIETKLYKNPDKRIVVAQVLDYGASLWRSSIDFSEFSSQLEKHVLKQFNTTLLEQIQSFFNVDAEGAETILESMQTNLNNGTFKFVVLMDNLERRLKDLILFMNRNSQFDVYAVELEYYKHEDFEIIIPKLYGAEIKKEVKSTSTYDRSPVTKDSFISHLQLPAEKNLASKLLSAFENDQQVKITWRKTGLSLSVNIPGATVYPTNYAFFFFHCTPNKQSDNGRLEFWYPEDAWRLRPEIHSAVKEYRDFYTGLTGYNNKKVGDLTIFDEKNIQILIEMIRSTTQKVLSILSDDSSS